MSKQIERIFICLLWLLATSLGACFWLNTFFGFNIFSTQHWQYLAYLQASQTPVRGGFYISIIILALITVIGLYVLMRPTDALRRLRRGRRSQNAPAQTTTTQTMTQPAQQIETAVPQPVPDIQPTATPNVNRPPRPINALRGAQTPGTTTNAAPAPSVMPNAAPNNFEEIKSIFTDAGYLVKRSPQIGNFKPALFAIGTNEQLWMGGIGISQKPIMDAAERMAGIFSDTLDDIEISINTFVIAPTEPIANPDILTFDTVNQLREYIDENKNIPPTDTDGGQENFDAYSEYIDTVITYMDKT
ncbi:hypothetical protein HDR61_01335 [bacterium]|nr:hypothetical protein [bacterium]